MFPYQVSQVLGNQHIHDMYAAAAPRREKAAHASPRFKAMRAWITKTIALPSSREGAPSRTTTSRSSAGPMGCSA